MDGVIKKDKSTEFIVVKKENTSINRNITISQSDIRQLQMAKAAFYSGMKLMLNHLNIP